jgi:hypothetical protein
MTKGKLTTSPIFLKTRDHITKIKHSSRVSLSISPLKIYYETN